MLKRQTPATARSLRNVSIFKEISASALTAIEQQCTWRTFAPGEAIIDYLDTSDDVFFIVSGKTRASIYSAHGRAVTFCDLGPGDMFGEYAAIDGAARSAGIEARARCLVATMPAATFKRMLRSEPDIAMALLVHAATRVRALTIRVYEFSAFAVKNRIQAELLRLARLAPCREGVAEINPVPSHADIASRTSTHREAVTRELSRLTKVGILERRGRLLLVTDVQRLEAMVSEATGE